MFYEWREGRQEDKNPFFEWLQYVLGITTTTAAPPLTPPTECAECSCGKSNKNKIVGGTETGVNQYPWMAMLLYSDRFYCGASLINDRYVMGKANSKLIGCRAYHLSLNHLFQWVNEQESFSLNGRNFFLTRQQVTASMASIHRE